MGRIISRAIASSRAFHDPETICDKASNSRSTAPAAVRDSKACSVARTRRRLGFARPPRLRFCMAVAHHGRGRRLRLPDCLLGWFPVCILARGDVRLLQLGAGAEDARVHRREVEYIFDGYRVARRKSRGVGNRRRRRRNTVGSGAGVALIIIRNDAADRSNNFIDGNILRVRLPSHSKFPSRRTDTHFLRILRGRRYTQATCRLAVASSRSTQGFLK